MVTQNWCMCTWWVYFIWSWSSSASLSTSTLVNSTQCLVHGLIVPSIEAVRSQKMNRSSAHASVLSMTFELGIRLHTLLALCLTLVVVVLCGDLLQQQTFQKFVEFVKLHTMQYMQVPVPFMHWSCAFCLWVLWLQIALFIAHNNIFRDYEYHLQAILSPLYAGLFPLLSAN